MPRAKPKPPAPISGKNKGPIVRPSKAPSRVPARVEAADTTEANKTLSEAAQEATEETALIQRLDAKLAGKAPEVIHSGEFPPTEEQRVVIDTALEGSPVVIVVAGAGCLAADTEINLNRGGKGFRMKLSSVVKRFNNAPDYAIKTYKAKGGETRACQVRVRPWDLSIPTLIARADNGVIRLGRLKAAWFSGDKETFTVTTESGRTVRATAIHPFLTEFGWRQLGDLQVGDKVSVNSGRSVSGRTVDITYPQTATMFHPYQTNNSVSGRTRFKVATHRAVVEAEMNGLTLGGFLAIVRTDEKRAKLLKYLPRHLLVHHKDENPNNFERSNLEVVDGTAEHSDKHEWVRNVLWQVGLEKVVSIERFGIEPTYDLEVEDDPHNFLANGFVVHNTGKTTTLRFLADNLPGNGQYTAFNTKLVEDSSSKFTGTRVACNTTHSLAFRALGHKYKHRLNGRRVRSHEVAKVIGLEGIEIKTADAYTDPITKKEEPEQWRWLKPGYLAAQLTKALGRFAQSADRTIEKKHFPYMDGIDAAVDGHKTYSNNDIVKEYLLDYAVKAWKDIQSIEGSFPFSHDYYVKLWQLGDPIISADYILLDEAQDSAPVLLDIVRRQKAQIILVGDSAQQIYDWRGAVDALKAFPNAPRAYLSQSFRFGPEIAAVANRVLETLEEKTPLRLKGFDKIDSKVTVVTNPTAILTRTNAVAVGHLLEALVGGKKAFLVGGGAEVASFVRAAKDLQEGKSTNHPELSCFNSWGEVEEYVKEDEGDDLKLMVKLINSFGADTILHALDAMPAEKDADLIISTAHKSKGREWDRVVLAADFPAARWDNLSPGYIVRTADEDEYSTVPHISRISDSDKRLAYVAVTRAKLELDISRCPFFTGERSFADFKDVAQKIKANPPKKSASSSSPAPSGQNGSSSYTWSKWDNAWVVRGPSGQAGQTVNVSRKDGSSSRRLLGKLIKEMGEVSLYE